MVGISSAAFLLHGKEFYVLLFEELLLNAFLAFTCPMLIPKSHALWMTRRRSKELTDITNVWSYIAPYINGKCL